MVQCGTPFLAVYDRYAGFNEVAGERERHWRWLTGAMGRHVGFNFQSAGMIGVFPGWPQVMVEFRIDPAAVREATTFELPYKIVTDRTDPLAGRLRLVLRYPESVPAGA